MEIVMCAMRNGNFLRNVASDPLVQTQLLNIETNKCSLVEPPYPSKPIFDPTMSMKRRISKIQHYIKAFEYNYIGKSFFLLRKDKGMKHLVYTAKCMMREPYPIQCVEAVFLAVHLTNSMKEILRIPLSFKTMMDGMEHSHIILAIRYKKKWGAIGISRIESLMNKEMSFDSLADLVLEFKNCYKKCCHEVVNVSVGLPFSHDDISESPLQWKILNLSPNEIVWEKLTRILIQYTKDCISFMEYFNHNGKLPNECISSYKRGIIKLKIRKRIT